MTGGSNYNGSLITGGSDRKGNRTIWRNKDLSINRFN